MRKKSKPPQAELNVFYNAMTGTRRIIQDKIRLQTTTQTRLPTQTISEPLFTIAENGAQQPTVGSEAKLRYCGEGVSEKTLRKLRQGQYTIEAMLDLHGMTIEAAKEALEHFLTHCFERQLRVVLIIHGKGHHSPESPSTRLPVLKNKINTWLRTLNHVLAFCSAQAAHGSRGAVYVLLRGKIK